MNERGPFSGPRLNYLQKSASLNIINTDNLYSHIHTSHALVNIHTNK